MTTMRPYDERILADVVVDANDCWLWQRYVGKDGYGYMGVKRDDGKWRMRVVHRVAYECWIGPIPDGLDLDHLCRVRACCNPTHLEPVTRKENLARGVGRWWRQQQRGRCKRDHDITGPNARTPHGTCRECQNLAQRKHRAKKKENTACLS